MSAVVVIQLKLLVMVFAALLSNPVQKVQIIMRVYVVPLVKPELVLLGTLALALVAIVDLHLAMVFAALLDKHVITMCAVLLVLVTLVLMVLVVVMLSVVELPVVILIKSVVLEFVKIRQMEFAAIIKVFVQQAMSVVVLMVAVQQVSAAIIFRVQQMQLKTDAVAMELGLLMALVARICHVQLEIHA